jgi:hypothetical protein
LTIVGSFALLHSLSLLIIPYHLIITPSILAFALLPPIHRSMYIMPPARHSLFFSEWRADVFGIQTQITIHKKPFLTYPTALLLLLCIFAFECTCSFLKCVHISCMAAFEKAFSLSLFL